MSRGEKINLYDIILCTHLLTKSLFYGRFLNNKDVYSAFRLS